MYATQVIIILFFFTFTGWLIAWGIARFLFWPEKPLKLGFITIWGLVPGTKGKVAKRAGEVFQGQLIAYNGLDEKLTDPELLQKLRPEIENHVDHFLNEKIKTVFPLLSQFMGEKTISQFKSSLLTEIDELFPVLMKKFSGELKTELRIDKVVEERINALEVEEIKDFFYAAAGKKIFLFKAICSLTGFIAGIVTLVILSFL
ncbi:MAG: hypothetical protein KBF74_05090 [Ferruginibacter sp.]|nr:hypothetical protein [Ferruginibacter sp.]